MHMMNLMLMPLEKNYFPPELKDTQYYFPTNRGMEIQIKEKLERLQEQDKNASKTL